MLAADSRTPWVDASLTAIAAEESRLDERLCAARAEAERIREAARGDARREADALAAELVTAERLLADAIAAERERAVEELRRDAEQRAAAFAAVTGSRASELAAEVVARLVETLPARGDPP